jgi:hypothetical protein
MFIVEVHANAVIARLNSMLQQLEHMRSKDLAREFGDWQTKDVHRRRPYIAKRKGVYTVFRPHSLYEMEASERAQRRLVRVQPRYAAYLASGKRRRRKPKYVRFVQMMQQRTSTRPILRYELEQALQKRMQAMLFHISWENTRAAAAVGRAKDTLESKTHSPIVKAIMKHLGSSGGSGGSGGGV